MYTQSPECQSNDWQDHKQDCETVASEGEVLPHKRYDSALKEVWDKLGGHRHLFASVSYL